MTTLMDDIYEYGEMKCRAGYHAGLLTGIFLYALIFMQNTLGNQFHLQMASLKAQL
jgi:hypothetical protein